MRTPFCSKAKSEKTNILFFSSSNLWTLRIRKICALCSQYNQPVQSIPWHLSFLLGHPVFLTKFVHPRNSFDIATHAFIRSKSEDEDRSPILNESLVEESGDENVFVGPEEEDDDDESSGEGEDEEEEGLEKMEEK